MRTITTRELFNIINCKDITVKHITGKYYLINKYNTSMLDVYITIGYRPIVNRLRKHIYVIAKLV